MPKNAAQFFSSRAGGKRLGGKNPLLNLSVGPGGKGTYNYITPFAAPSFTPALMTANSQAALPDNNLANMQRRKGMIAKAGLAYAMTSILPSAANLVGAYGHSKLEYLMTAFGRIGEDAAKGAGIGLAVGAASSGGAGAMPGAVVGGLAGGIVSGIKEIIDVLALFKKNAKAAADSLKRVSDADRAAISTTLVALREANRISSISGMTREQASAAYDTAAKHVALI